MNIEKKESFIGYLDERTSTVQADIVRLNEDHRRDEADFEKIRGNIFQVIKTMVQASERISDNEDEQIQFVDSKLTMFTETWKESMAKATEHNDERRILQEQVKLEAMDEIRSTFERIWRQTHE